MSLSIKKFFSAIVISIAVFSLALSASAQAVSTSNMIQATPDELSAINSLPEVYVKDLVLDRELYKAGDTMKGSFVLVNVKDTTVSNLNYRAYLVGDLMAGNMYRYEFDGKVLGTVFLGEKENKKINFEYKLPLVSSAYTIGKQLGIKISAYSGSGSSLGSTATKVAVSDSGISPVVINNPLVSVGGKTFKLNEGPMVYSDQKVSLIMSARNDSAQDINGLTPKISIYDMDYAREPLIVYSEKEFSLKSKSILDLDYNLPVFDYTPKVYAGEMILLDKGGVDRVGPIKFRYIVFGEVVNIQNIVVDKDSAKKGEMVAVKVNYSGTPYDISKLTVASTTPSDFSLKLFNERDELVGSYSDKTNFRGLGSKEVKITLEKEARAFGVEIVISKDGKIITEYRSVLTGNMDQIRAESMSGDKTRNIIYVGGIILLLIIIGAIVLVKNRRKALIIPLALIILGFGGLINRAEAFTVTSVFNSQGIETAPNVFVTSPAPEAVRTYLPEQSFPLTGYVNTIICSNSNYKIKVFASSNGVNWENIVNTGWEAGAVCGTHWCSTSNVDFNGGTFSAAGTPGTHRVYLKVESYFDYGGVDTLLGRIIGYQNYEVALPPTPSNLTASCPVPGSTTTLRWNAVSGATYRLEVDNKANAFEPRCNMSWFTGDKCLVSVPNNTYSFASIPDANYRWRVNTIIEGILSATSTGPDFTCASSAPAPVLSVSCSSSATNSGIAPSTVTWIASSTGGTTPYTYSWTGSDGLSGNTSSVSKLYSSAGVYYATTTVRDAAGTTLNVSCPGTLTASGNPGDTTSGGCTSNCGKTIISGAVAGVCTNNLSAPDLATLNSYELCYYSSSINTPVTGSGIAGDLWTWTCSGINGSATSSPACTATLNTNPSGFNCSVTMKPPQGTVPVNNNTHWEATSTTPGFAGMLKQWYVNGGMTPVYDVDPADNVLDIIFTTIGLKTITVAVASTTGGVYQTCTSAPATATTTVTQSGVIIEI